MSSGPMFLLTWICFHKYRTRRMCVWMPRARHLRSAPRSPVDSHFYHLVHWRSLRGAQIDGHMLFGGVNVCVGVCVCVCTGHFKPWVSWGATSVFVQAHTRVHVRTLPTTTSCIIAAASCGATSDTLNVKITVTVGVTNTPKMYGVSFQYVKN